MGRGERCYVESIEPGADDADEPVKERQRRASGLVNLPEVERTPRDTGHHQRALGAAGIRCRLLVAVGQAPSWRSASLGLS
jgi:hypothetical protein